MSGKYRVIHSSFWNEDPEVYEMTTEPKMFYAYLLTSPWSKQCGISKVSFKTISDQTGHSVDNVKLLIKRFEEEYKKVRYNPETKELAIKNWVKWNCQGKNPKVEICIQKELLQVKDKTLIDYVWEGTKKIPEPEHTPDKETEGRNKAIKEIFEYWQLLMKHPKSVLSPERRLSINARLNDGYTLDECKAGIRGCAGSEYHMGKNDTRTVYDSIGLIFRNASKLDGFIARSQRKKAPQTIEEKTREDDWDWGTREEK